MSERETSLVGRIGREEIAFPSAEELRMVRAIALLALLEAARHGTYNAFFHGFRVQALRQSTPPGSGVTIEVNLLVSLGGELVERGVVAVQVPQRECHGVPVIQRAGQSVAYEIEPITGATVM